MIKFDLICENQHIFEASFDDSNSFEKQKRKKQIECPFCNSSTISKSVMAPNISGKSTSSAKINREKKKLFLNYNKQSIAFLLWVKLSNITLPNILLTLLQMGKHSEIGIIK